MGAPLDLRRIIPSPQAITEAPERAALAILEVALLTAIQTITAAWPELADDETRARLRGRPAIVPLPTAPRPPLRYAAAITDQALRLSETVRAYRAFLASFLEEKAMAERPDDIPF